MIWIFQISCSQMTLKKILGAKLDIIKVLTSILIAFSLVFFSCDATWQKEGQRQGSRN